MSSVTTLSLYACLLATVLLTPYASLALGPRLDRYWPVTWKSLCALLLVGAIILTIARDADVFLLCALLVLPLAGFGMTAILGGTTAVLLFMTVTWWTKDLPAQGVRGGVFLVLALAAILLPRWGKTPSPATAGSRLLWRMLACLLLGLSAGLLTAPFEALDPLHGVWHHWSAYLSPVEAWRGGGVPYRDFPIQYGLGPTMVLKATCGSDCWRSMYVTTIVANALYFATLAGSVMILTTGTARGFRWLALIAMFCASFIWTGYPVQFAGPAMTPSVAGLRFLSISALLLHILIAEQRKVPRDWIGHLLWLASLFWSYEAGVFTTLIWWPYLALRDAGSAHESLGVIKALIGGIVRGACACAIGGSALWLTLWLLSERSITVGDFLAYVQHPPGALFINPVGTIWIALASVGLTLPLLARQGLSSQARPFYVCLIGFAAAGIYYISRSHDNNILNLFPLLVLLLLAISANRDRAFEASPGFAGAFVHVMLAAMVAFVATFNFGPWREGIARAGLFTVGPARLLSRLTPVQGSSPAVMPSDGIAGLEYLRSRNAGMVILFDRWNVMPRGPGGTAWTGVNSIANFSPLPPSMILHYIQRGAAAYNRPGWILADARHYNWVAAFKTAYTVREQHSFGTYTAYYVVPTASIR